MKFRAIFTLTEFNFGFWNKICFFVVSMKGIVVLFLVFSLFGFGQQSNYNDSLVTITGQVVDTIHSVGFYNVVVINKTVGKGIFGEHDGKFKITVKKSNVVGVSVSGYKTIYLSFKDSIYQNNYHVDLVLTPLVIQGKEVGRIKGRARKYCQARSPCCYSYERNSKSNYCFIHGF